MTTSGHASLTAPGGFQLTGERVPSRIRRVIARRSIPCPDCGAGIDVACISSTGRQLNSSHTARTRMATRAYLEAVQPKADKRTALVIYRTTRYRHALTNNGPACGMRYNHQEAIRDGKLSSGIAVDVTCPDCRAALRTAA